MNGPGRSTCSSDLPLRSSGAPAGGAAIFDTIPIARGTTRILDRLSANPAILRCDVRFFPSFINSYRLVRHVCSLLPAEIPCSASKDAISSKVETRRLRNDSLYCFDSRPCGRLPRNFPPAGLRIAYSSRNAHNSCLPHLSASPEALLFPKKIDAPRQQKSAELNIIKSSATNVGESRRVSDANGWFGGP
jgi:hypothetical protein